MGKKMFDYVIGNPPYQEDAVGTSDKPVYNYFMDAAYQLADKVELIHPARFLFDTGKTPKAWNEKMLCDEHLKVMYYEQESVKIFPNTSITGGIAITYHDVNANFGEIEVFSRFEQLRTIREKISPYIVDGNIIDIMFAQNRFNLETLYVDYPEYRKLISSDGKERRIVSSAFQKLSVFSDNEVDDNCIRILGINEGKRKIRLIKKEYVEDNGNLNNWKVVVSKSNGASGTLGEEAARIIAPPMICEPLVGYTQTFIGIGNFPTLDEAQACLKYVMSKFARALLGILKATQDNPPDRWKYVPLQDFTENSDIDWSKSVHEIDLQLYRKYGLDEKEIEFIETHVKEMSI